MNGVFDKLIRYSLRGGLPLQLLLFSLILGVIALLYTPREEEPQIIVPMVDVLVEAPGLSAKQVERQVTTPLEKLLAQIPGVEHVYSTSRSGKSLVTLRFFVGEDRENSILNTYNKLYSNNDKVPAVVKQWLVRPVEVDDVPIVLLALWSDSPERYSDYELRRVADEVATSLQGIAKTSEVKVTGGRPRTIRILIDPESMTARKTTPTDIVHAIEVSNVLQSAGQWAFNNESIILESGSFVSDANQLKTIIINVIDGMPVYLQDVAQLIDGPAEAQYHTWLDFAQGHPSYTADINSFPMVAISIAKQRGSNAVSVAHDVHQQIEAFKNTLLPPQIHVEIIRDYGETANQKVNNLATSLGFAVFTVVVFIGIFLGWRPALVVGLAVPICYGFTLALDMLFGYTINRVTLFALILSLGLLVDDPITGIDNITRFMKMGKDKASDQIVAAMTEIRIPLLMSTLTIILAFIPLMFITGMMGPYMAPMAFNVPVSVITSTVVAFLVTPWLASKLLKPSATDDTRALEGEPKVLVFYRRLISPLLLNRYRAKWVLMGVLVIFIAAALLPVLRLVPLKLLPFDNKNEVQIVVDMPESATLEYTAAICRQISTLASRLPEVQAIAVFAGLPSPVDFNGLVRQYSMRVGANMADLRLTLIDKSQRLHRSHDIVLRLRKLLAPLNSGDIKIKVVEVPPGPPVLSTLVAEIYGSVLTPYDTQREAAEALMTRLAREAHVVEIDSTLEHDQKLWRFVTDKQKAALSGIATNDINNTIKMANQGYTVGYLQIPSEAKPLPIEIRLAPHQRVSINDFESLHVKGQAGVVQLNSPAGLDTAPQPLVALGELGQFKKLIADKAIYHKDLKPVVYVMAELSGRTPAEVIADVFADENAQSRPHRHWRDRHFLMNGAGDAWELPAGTHAVWSGEGEWRITVEVFRDMGLAFAFALVGIFIVLRVQMGSTALSLIIMSAIPLTIIGIMPGFWLLNQIGEREIAGAPEPILFTATAMIGMIALAGIVVRNSLILVEFINQARERGLPLKEALVHAGAIRMRPVLLTAGTTLLGNLIITLDPVFSGLALAIIFGIIASTLFTLIVVPVVYMLAFDKSSQDQVN